MVQFNKELQNLLQLLTYLTSKLTTNQKKFATEVIGTFIVVVFATGSVVIDAKLNGRLGVSFIAFARTGI